MQPDAGRQSPPHSDAVPEPLLAVRNLAVELRGGFGTTYAVQGVSYDVVRGKTLGIVGESGSGKTVSALALMNLIPPAGRVTDGSFEWKGDALELAELGRLRGSRITMIFQDPLSSLDPLMPVGRQITEVLRQHRGMRHRPARAEAEELLALVGVPEPAKRMRQYPFEFSGGMAQRAMIAMALAPQPDLIIADEPTTALDVTIQAQILELIGTLQAQLGVAMILITHDLGVVASVTDSLAVMYAGRAVETGTTSEVFARPAHPYTKGLLNSTPHPRDLGVGLVPIPGSPPVAAAVTDSCSFANRCAFVTDQCRTRRPELLGLSHGQPPSGEHTQRQVACWHDLLDA